MKTYHKYKVIQDFILYKIFFSKGDILYISDPTDSWDTGISYRVIYDSNKKRIDDLVTDSNYEKMLRRFTSLIE